MEIEKNQPLPIPDAHFRVTENDMKAIRELLSAEFKESINDIPTFLYQYRPVNLHTLDQINKKYIWCSSPANFNDIYDSRGLYKFIKGVYQKIDNNKLREVDRDSVISSFLDELRISSFTSTSLDQTMWSHYADRYTGICIKYDIESVKECIYRVNYSVKMEDISDIGRKLLKRLGKQTNLIACDANILLTLLSSLFKNISWNYEKEYRYVSFSSILSGNKVELSPAQIIFGPKAEESAINIIKNLVSNDETQLAKIVLKRDNVAFEIESIQP